MGSFYTRYEPWDELPTTSIAGFRPLSRTPAGISSVSLGFSRAAQADRILHNSARSTNDVTSSGPRTTGLPAAVRLRICEKAANLERNSGDQRSHLEVDA